MDDLDDLDDLGQCLARAEVRRAAIADAPVLDRAETPEEKVARLRSAADVARQHHDAALLEYRELQKVMHKISGVLLLRVLEDIETCRVEAFHAQRKFVPFSPREERLAAIAAEKELQRKFTGD